MVGKLDRAVPRDDLQRRKAAGRRVPADRGASVKSAARRSANFSAPLGDGGSGDPPIIITGGNSVHVTVPDKFSEDGSGKKGGKFTHGTGTMTEIVVDGGMTVRCD